MTLRQLCRCLRNTKGFLSQGSPCISGTPALPITSLRQYTAYSPQDTLGAGQPINGSDQICQVNHDFEVWTWGRGDSGQLGHGDEKDEAVPRKIVSLAVPSNAPKPDAPTPESDKTGAREGLDSSSETDASSLGHGTIATDGGQGSSFGVSCGLFHSACWGGAGNLWLWGKGDGGRLGFNDEATTYSPRANDLLPPVQTAALGGLHSAALTRGGELYTWGYGGFGALGHNGYTREVVPRQVDGEWRREGARLTQVAAGGAHTAVIAESGVVYTWGRDEGEGRLGHAGADPYGEGSIPTPKPVLDLPPTARVSCGGFFTMALTPAGEVWTWGGNMNSELGRGPGRRHQWRPQPITALDSPVVHISTGGYHAAAVDEKGRLWTWGRGGHGQLGHGSLQTESSPRLVEGLSGLRMVAAACGGSWTAAIAEEGKLFVWGKNTESQLGQPGLSGLVPFPHQLEIGRPSDGEHLRQVVAVGAGASHGVALVQKVKR